nr:accessory gene regulator B family protein [Clostridium acidisoli]
MIYIILLSNVSKLICSYINNNCEISDKDNEKINYAIIAILSESVKFIFLFFLFFILHRLKFFIFSLIILMSIRNFSGGLHFKTFNKCLLFSVTVFIMTSLLAPMIPRLPNLIYYFFCFISVLIIFIKSPCTSPKRPIRNNKKKYRLKVISTISSIICLILLVVVRNNNSLVNCGFVTILIQAIQLILA